MSDFRFRNLDKFTVSHGTNETRMLSMNRPTSGTEKVMERCPNPECQPAVFQLGRAPEIREIADEDRVLVRRQPGEEGITCPYCGTDGHDNEFIAQEDFEHAKKEAVHAVKQDISDMLGDMTRRFNQGSRSSSSMISMTMKHQPSYNPKPLAYREDLLRGISCHVCQREYGVYALALFCPDCGVPNVSTHFNREIDIINQQIKISKQIDNEENREVSYRLLANAHEDAITALETTLKAIFKHIILSRFPEQKEKLSAIGTAFQNLEKAKKKFAELNIALLDALTKDEESALFKAIQKRHVIGHNLGLADEKYIKVASDVEVGQNVPILAEEIERFTSLCAQLICSLEKELMHDS